MRGCIVKKGERYYLKYYVDGKQRWKVAGPRKKDAERMLNDIVSSIQAGSYREPKKITFAQFAAKWLEDYASVAVKHSTFITYECLLRRHLCPLLGDYELTGITPELVQSLVSRMGRERGLSPKTIRNVLAPLREMFNHAVRWGYLKENPALYVEKPRVPDREMDFLTKDEIRTFLENVPARRYALFLTAILTGVRRGELLAMKWANLDWGRKQYYVKESLYRATFVEPKSRNSKRAIDLPDTLVEVLRHHQVAQHAQRLKTGPQYNDLGLIFCGEEGKPLDPDNLVKRDLERALRDAGIRRIRFHDLRHTYAALLVAQGENPKYIQNQLGHASIQTTLDRYGHLMPETHQEAARRLEEALFGRSSRKIVEIGPADTKKGATAIAVTP